MKALRNTKGPTLRTLRTYLSRVIRDIVRRVKGNEDLKQTLSLARRVREQDRHQHGPKVYSLLRPRCAGMRSSEIRPKDPPRVERNKMRALDVSKKRHNCWRTSGSYALFIPMLLGVLCGLRRGDITALRWRSMDLTRGQISIAESTEQTRKGICYKETKSGRSRTVALPSLAVDELRKHRVRQAEEFLWIGLRPQDETRLIAEEYAKPLQPNSFTHEFMRIPAQSKVYRKSAFMIWQSHVTHLLSNRIHQRVAQEAARSLNGWDYPATFCLACRRDAAAKVDATIWAAIEGTG